MTSTERNKSRKDDTHIGVGEASIVPSDRTAPIDLSSFTLEQCSLEARYAVALLLWDRAGALWRSIQDKWPDIHLVTADPTKQAFQTEKTGFVIELQAARITTMDSHKSLTELSGIAREFFKLAAKHLQISLFTRLGLRLIYFKEFKDRETAASAFHSLHLVRVPNNKKFEIEETPVNPQYSLRWESAKKGTLVTCRAETRKTDFDPPIESVRLFTPIHKEVNGIVVDIDYYTVAPVDSGQVDMGEWLSHAQHVVVRDTRYLFED
jgi:hypothetical protein